MTTLVLPRRAWVRAMPFIVPMGLFLRLPLRWFFRLDDI